MRSLPFFLVLLCALPAAVAQNAMLTVGKQPLAVLPVHGNVHIFCGRIDQNFNGTQDPEDVPPSWWIVDAHTFSIKNSVSLPWQALSFPVRIAIDSVHNIIYLPVADSIFAYDLNTQQAVDTFAIGKFARSVSIDIPSQTLFFCTADPSTVYRYNLATGNLETLFSADTIAFAQTALPIRLRNGDSLLAVLFEGTFGQTDSRLLLLYPDHTRSFAIGGLGNHIAAFGDTLVVTMNGSHQVHLVDLRSETIVKTLATGTDGYNGPRESLLWKNWLITSTYNSDIRIFDLDNGSLKYTLHSGGKPEGIAIVNGKLWVANAFQTDSYTPDSTVAILELPVTTVPLAQNSNGTVPLRWRFDAQATVLHIASRQGTLPVQQLSIFTADGKHLFETHNLMLSESWQSLPLPTDIATTMMYVLVRTEHHRYQFAVPLVR